MAYAVITDRVLHDQKSPKRTSGYSKLAAQPSITDNISTPAAKQTAPTPTAPDWLWSEDRQLKQLIFAEVQALSGRKFTLGAAATDNGSNAKCDEFCSPANSFLDSVHTGHIWINAQFSKLLSFVQHYLHCKQLAPDDTSACMLIPGFLLKPLRSFLTGMRLLKRFNKGTQLFTAVDKCGQGKAMPGVHWPVYICTDLPAISLLKIHLFMICIMQLLYQTLLICMLLRHLLHGVLTNI